MGMGWRKTETQRGKGCSSFNIPSHVRNLKKVYAFIPSEERGNENGDNVTSGNRDGGQQQKNPFLHPTPNRSSSHHKSHRTHHQRNT